MGLVAEVALHISRRWVNSAGLISDCRDSHCETRTSSLGQSRKNNSTFLSGGSLIYDTFPDDFYARTYLLQVLSLSSSAIRRRRQLLAIVTKGQTAKVVGAGTSPASQHAWDGKVKRTGALGCTLVHTLAWVSMAHDMDNGH